MSTNYSAKGSATVRRLKNGDTVYLTLEGNGIALFQGIDPTALTPTPTPSWKVAANQPELTPKFTSARNNTIKIVNHEWKYMGTLLVFTGAADGSYTKDSTGKFEMNKATGALKIISDLADSNNFGNNVLTYTGKIEAGETTYTLSRDRDVTIVKMGAGIYTGVLTATKMQIGDGETSVIKTALYAGTALATDYYVKWFKDGDTNEIDKFRGQKSITVGRDDIDSSTLFLAIFFASSTATQPLARSGIRIVDNRDEFMVVYQFVSDNKAVDTGKPVTMKGQVINTTKNSVVDLTNANPSWESVVMDTQHWVEIRTVNSDTVTITTDDTDRKYNGIKEENDVEVLGSVDFTL